MGATIFSQFLLLCWKNLKVKVLRQPISFLLEITLPIGIGLILLWARGFVNPKDMPSMKFPEYEFSRWPAGLDAPYVNDTSGKSEFILFYAPQNTKTNELVQKAVDNMNENYAKWYSYEEYLLDKVIYSPILEVAQRENLNETAATLLNNYLDGYMPSTKLSEKAINEFLYGETASCVDSTKCDAVATTIAEKQEWIKDNLLVEIRKTAWGQCTRPYLAMQLMTMASHLACNSVEGVAARTAQDMEYLSNMSEADKNVFTLDGNCDEMHNDYKEYDSIFRKNDPNHKSSGYGTCRKVSIESRNNRIINTLRGARSIPNLSSFCATPEHLTSLNFLPNAAESAANVVHAASPRLEIVKYGFDSIQEMTDFVLDTQGTNDKLVRRRLMQVEIDNGDEFNGENYPKNFKYTVRPTPNERNTKSSIGGDFQRAKLREALTEFGVYWSTMQIKTFQFQLPRIGPERMKLTCGGNTPNYYKEGVAMVQETLDTAFLAGKTPGHDVDGWRYQYARFPYGAFTLDVFPILLQFFGMSLQVLGTLFLILSAVRAPVDEKETKVKEYMKVMGSTNLCQWLSWIAHYTIVTLIISTLLTTVYCSKTMAEGSFAFSWDLDKDLDGNQTLYDERVTATLPVIGNSQPFLIFITFFINFLQFVFCSFLFSTFFDSSSSAAGVTGMAHFVTSGMWSFYQTSYSEIGRFDKIISCFLPTFSLGHIWHMISTYEGTGVGLTNESIHYTYSDNNDISMFELWFIMIAVIISYFTLTLYIETCFPGEFGVKQPLLFFIDKQYWFPPPPRSIEVTNDDKFKNLLCYEELTSNEKEHVKLKILGLRKEFQALDGLKIAVKDMYMDVVHGEITTLLGHNGAGKSSLMNMLTGMYAPSQGTAIVNGHDIVHDMSGVRQSLGLCPQFNILFPTLTIREHLEFFAGMKGVPRDKIKEEVDNTIKQLRFQGYSNNYPTELSGGWKRRLSVAIAVIGGSQCVILDEPTSGMDPSTRRVLWSILKEMKSQRMIILSTHFMDEADILGDRIAIMSGGELQAIGSSHFLKNYFGCGYHLLLSSLDDEFSSIQVQQITDLVKNFIPKMKIERCIGQEFNIILPFDSVHKFEGLFKEVEKVKDQYGILSYGVMLTSMDEVFLKCNEKAHRRHKAMQESEASMVSRLYNVLNYLTRSSRKFKNKSKYLDFFSSQNF
jgi:ABC-type multidrug transport system ATPase subunit